MARILLLVGMLGLLVPVPRAAAQVPPGTTRILVMPFEAADRDHRALWLGEASAILVSDILRGLAMPALTRPERLRAFADVNMPADDSLSFASRIRIGQLVAASDLIVGSLRLTGDEIVVEARRVRLDTGRVVEQTTDRAPLRDLFVLHERVAHRLMGVTERRPRRDWPPIEAFELYVKGLVAEQPAAQVKFLQAALAAHPGYDRALLGLWETYSDQDEHAKALAAAQGVKADSRLSRRARFYAGLSLIELNRLDEAFAAFKALLDERPAASLHNNLGVVQVRRGGTPQAGRATYYFTKAAEFNPEEPDYFFNLGYAYWLDKDVPAAVYWLREAVRRNTADGDAHFVLGAALQATGAGSEAARERELARQLSSKYDAWEKRPATGEAVPKKLERLSPELETVHGTSLDAALLTSAQREQQELAAFHLERGRRLVEQEHNHEALTELRKAIYLSAYDSEPHVLIGRIYLRTGRPRDAVDAFRVALWSQESAAVRLALAEALLLTGDEASARREATRAIELDPALAEAKALLVKIDKR